MNVNFHRFSLGKYCAALLFMLGLTLLSTSAQDALPANSYLQDQQTLNKAKLSPESLNQLVSPIALYPDALIALMLPASTVPSDVVLGARYLADHQDPSQVDAQPWDESVKSLTRYPDVLSWMNHNLAWTTSLGEAFVAQPADVMNAIQALRAQAKTQGNLVDTPQQKIVTENDNIRIVPADPETIYVPQYDPGVVYTQPYSPDYTPLITFGIGWAVGSWLSYDFDWNNRGFYHGNWQGWNNGWNGNGRGNGGTVNVVNISNNGATPWQPSANSVTQISRQLRNNGGNARIARAEARQQIAHGVSPSSRVGGYDPAHSAKLVPRPSRLSASTHTRPNSVTPGNISSSPKSESSENRTSPSTGNNVSVDRAVTKSPVSKNLSMTQNPSAAPHVAGELSSHSKSHHGISSGHPEPSTLPSSAEIPTLAQTEKANPSHSQKNKTQTAPSESSALRNSLQGNVKHHHPSQSQSHSVSPKSNESNPTTIRAPKSSAQTLESEHPRPAMPARPVPHAEQAQSSHPIVHSSQSHQVVPQSPVKQPQAKPPVKAPPASANAAKEKNKDDKKAN